jgi:hypothetical protein
MHMPHVTVETYAGYKGEETPRSFTLDGRKVPVRTILDCWYTNTHCCFRVLAGDGARYVLRYNLDGGSWEMVMQEGTTED